MGPWCAGAWTEGRGNRPRTRTRHWHRLPLVHDEALIERTVVAVAGARREAASEA